MKYKIAITSWCGLGFIRGINYYKYDYNKYEKNEPYMYLTSLSYGLFGIIVYANPILLPITIHKELYRFEIDMRNLETKKKSMYYNHLI